MSEMQHFGRLIILLLLIGLLTVTVLLILNNPGPQPATPPLTGDKPVVLVGAGDIAECGTQGDEATAALIDGVIAEHSDAVVFTSGDNAYDGGLPEEFDECCAPSWGRFRDRTRPAVGNHEFGARMAAGYSDYFDEAAGEFDKAAADAVYRSLRVAVPAGLGCQLHRQRQRRLPLAPQGHIRSICGSRAGTSSE